MRIKLLKDLTAYGPTLVEGAIGLAREEKVSFTDNGWEMVEVKIPGTPALPIGWNGLEIIDKGFWKERDRQVRNATAIRLKEGPRGGFKGLDLIYEIGGDMKFTSAYNKLDAYRIVEIAKKYGKHVERHIM